VRGDRLKKHLFTVTLAVSFVLAGIAHYSGWSSTLQFAIACAAIIFVAGFLGKATESVAHYAGERIGGFLNATFGNAAELIIAVILIKDAVNGKPQLFEIVKASITGSIIGNLLLVLGLSVLIGGARYKEQKFNIHLAAHNSSLMLLSVIALFIPAIFSKDLSRAEMDKFSLIVAGVLIVAYFLWLYFSMVTHKNILTDEQTEHGEAAWSKSRSILYLVLATVMVALISEWLVGSVEAFTRRFNLSELFVGAFLIAIIGNAAEHSAAIIMALKNKIGASVEIAVGSGLQISLFVAPVLVFVSFFLGYTMNLVFSLYEIAAIGVSAFISSSISRDGRTHWYEGVLLLSVYIILGIAFFFV
jgi:Ca2+:H+ antiporter